MRTLLTGLFLLACFSLLSAQTGFDPAFGENGVVTTNFGGKITDCRVSRQSGGKLLIGGALQDAVTRNEYVILRYDANGAPDSTFVGTGVLKSDLSILYSGTFTVLENDKILVAGDTAIYAFTLSQFLPDGTPDSTFGQFGQATAQFDEIWSCWVNDLAVQSDGKILVAGGANAHFKQGGVFFIARFHPAGIPDSTFGNNGLVFQDTFFQVNDLAIQPDGKILAGTSFSPDFYFGTLARLNPDGSFDTSFGMNGITAVDSTIYSNPGVNVLLHPDGTILLCGPGSISKFSTEGVLDTLFGTGGSVALNHYEMDLFAALQPDGKILVSSPDFVPNDQQNILLRRFLPEGKVDSIFGTNGMKVINVWSIDFARSLLPLPDGKTAIASISDRKLALIQILQDGEPDPDFGIGGTAITYFGGFHAVAEGAAIQTNGKLLVAGSAERGDAVMARYLDDGTLDPSFGNGGKVVTDIKDFPLSPSAMVIQHDGKIVLAGGGGEYFSLLRYLPDGELDASFGENGLVAIEIGDYLAKCHALALQQDGKLVLGGIAFKDRFLARVNPDGGLDPAFGEGGLIIDQDNEYFNPIFDIKIQPDGKIVACGDGAHGFNLFRYLPDGSPDYSFNFLGKAKTGLYEATSLLVLPDGKILVAGSTGAVRRNPKIIRFLPTGAIDPGFEFSEYFSDTPVNFGYIEDIALQDNGKIVFTGYVKKHKSLFIGRALPSGSLDSSFFGVGFINFLNSGFPTLPRFVTVLQNGKIVVTGGSENWDNWAGQNIDSDFLILRIPADPHVGVTEQNPGISALFLSPNPLQSQATLSYELTNSETLSIQLHDASGKPLCMLVNEEKRPAGPNREVLSLPKNLPDGAYYLTLRTAKGQRSVALILNR